MSIALKKLRSGLSGFFSFSCGLVAPKSLVSLIKSPAVLFIIAEPAYLPGSKASRRSHGVLHRPVLGHVVQGNGFSAFELPGLYAWAISTSISSSGNACWRACQNLGSENPAKPKCGLESAM